MVVFRTSGKSGLVSTAIATLWFGMVVFRTSGKSGLVSTAIVTLWIGMFVFKTSGKFFVLTLEEVAICSKFTSKLIDGFVITGKFG